MRYGCDYDGGAAQYLKTIYVKVAFDSQIFYTLR